MSAVELRWELTARLREAGYAITSDPVIVIGRRGAVRTYSIAFVVDRCVWVNESREIFRREELVQWIDDIIDEIGGPKSDRPRFVGAQGVSTPSLAASTRYSFATARSTKSV